MTIESHHMLLRRMLQMRDAATYCGVPIKRFRNVCSAPITEMPGGVKRWDVKDLDMWLDQVKKTSLHSDDEIIERLGK